MVMMLKKMALVQWSAYHVKLLGLNTPAPKQKYYKPVPQQQLNCFNIGRTN